MRRMIGILSGLIAATALLLGLWASQQAAEAAAWEAKVDPWVLATADANAETEFLVYLTEQADLSGAASLTTKEAKGAYVYEQLTAVAQRTQPALIAQLDALGVPYRRHWITNMVWVRGSSGVIEALARREDVAHLYANPTVAMPPLPENEAVLSPEVIEWNILKVNADDVWAMGYTGDGIVVGGQDTGYDWDHVGLIVQYRGWNGVTADHDYNWHDAIHSGGGVCGPNSPEPCDDHGHGTHTMGTMVGNDMPPSNPGWPASATNAVGMAPGAEWISCRNMNVGDGTPATYSECYEWFIAPYPVGGDPFNDGDPTKAPHVINNSWGCPPSEGCTDPNVLLSVVQAVRAAGIVTVHSAGNEGSGCSSVQTPSAIYDESFSVGSTTSTDAISSFSSRGPVLIDGSGRRKPDISAPGSSIRSTTRYNNYGTSSGTSMAGPHVAGLVALVLSANPGLAGNVDVIEQIIQDSALHLTTTQGCGGDSPTAVPNNVFGWGRIDALEAVNLALAMQTLTISKIASADWVLPGDLLTYTIAVTYHNAVSPTHNLILTDVLPANTTFVTATLPHTFDGSVVTWTRASLNAGDAWTVELVVQVDEAASGEAANEIYEVQSDEVTAVAGPPVITPILPHTLTLSKTAPTQVIAGASLTYTLAVEHQHAYSATTNVILSDTLPQNTTFVTATQPFQQNGDVISWQAPTLDNETWQVHLVVAVDEDAAADIVNANYGVHSDQVAMLAGLPVTTTLLTGELLTITVDVTGTAVPGAPLTYTFTITSTQIALHNLVLTDTLPAQTTLITATMPFTIVNNVVQWERLLLGAGEAWQVTLVVQVSPTAVGNIVNDMYGVKSDEVTAVTGPPVITPVIQQMIYLPYIGQAAP